MPAQTTMQKPCVNLVKPKRRTITVDMPQWMIEQLDESALAKTMSRSAFLRQLIIENTKTQKP
jgi:metal-responsive CopG/Arc/MetJ family transcriptional regulator